MDYYIDVSQEYKVTEIAKLFATYYDDTYNIVNSNYLEWQYLQNPNGRAIISQARSTNDNTLVGVYILNPVELNTFGISALSLNTFTHADYRGKGMFTKLAKDCYEKAKERGIKSIVGFPNRMSYGGFINKLGFNDLGNVEYLIKAINPMKSLLEIVSGGGRSNNKLLFNKELHSLTDVRTNEVRDFLTKWNNKNKLTVRRSVDYYHWRYEMHPTNKYSFLIHRVNDSIDALIIVKKSVKRVSQLFILDFLWLNPESASQLFRNLQKSVKKNVSVIRLYSNPMHPDHELYKALGFFNSNKLRKINLDVQLIYRSLTQLSSLPLYSDWRISLGDADME